MQVTGDPRTPNVAKQCHACKFLLLCEGDTAEIFRPLAYLTDNLAEDRVRGSRLRCFLRGGPIDDLNNYICI